MRAIEFYDLCQLNQILLSLQNDLCLDAITYEFFTPLCFIIKNQHYEDYENYYRYAAPNFFNELQ